VCCRLQRQCFVKRLKLSTPAFIHGCICPAFRLSPPPFATSALTRFCFPLEGPQRREHASTLWSVVSTLCVQMYRRVVLASRDGASSPTYRVGSWLLLANLTPWSESASELYRPRERRLSAK
jgi:hypothetical protein